MKRSATLSVWRDIRLPKSRRLSGARRSDVVIVGGGMTGLTAAWLLKQAGKTVTVLERDRLGSADTSHTTAHLTMVTDIRLEQLATNFGKGGAQLAWRGGLAAIGTIERIVERLGIACEFRRVPCYLHAAIGGKDDETAVLREEAALARELGFEAEFVESAPFTSLPAVRYGQQAKFHPLKYLAALAATIPGDGSEIFERSEVSEISAEPDRPLIVKCGTAEVTADYVIIATHVPLMGATDVLSAALRQTKIYPYTSYVVSGSLPRGRVPEGLYWDTSDPYYYLRIDAGDENDRLIFGGLDHKTGQETDTQQRLVELRSTLHALLPEATIDRQWSGQVIATNDGLPYMGETAHRQFVVTGFNGNGLTFGTLGAMLACDTALRRDNPWRELFSIDRKHLKGGTWTYLKENLDYPYYFLLDRLPSSRRSPTELQPGEGQVLNLDGERVACARDESGKLHQVSAVCTHLGCLVRWNGAQQTWDCPCHGSRFSVSGEVLAGPAESPLAAAEALGLE